ncbi:MAG: class I SAM-dependent methyltransferase [Ahrensia sp.]|nr:class I SAM-dependent methyltransferase [Ahrensia sp.]
MANEPKENADSGHFSAAYDLESGEQTKAHYASWADSYDREVSEENAYAQPVRVAEMVGRFVSDTDALILDAGCGSGLSGTALAASGFRHLHGCDFSQEMLAKAAEKGVYAKLFAADLNAGLPDVDSQTFDVVTCVGVFSFGHVEPDACDELLRVLKPGGFLIIALNDPFWQRGDLASKIEQLEGDKRVIVRAKEFGDHLPGHNVMGWVIALEKTS